MARLGGLFIVGTFFQLRVDDRSVLFPFIAVAGLVQLVRLAPYRALSRITWFAATVSCAAVACAAGFAALVPTIEPGGPSSVATLAATVGVVCWAGVLHDWSLAQGWGPPAAKAASARAWMLAAAVVFSAWLVTYVALVEPGPAVDASYSPAVLFGRPLEGWTPIAAILVTSAFAITGLVKLRGASQAIRHSLRAQPAGVLVGA